MYKILIIEDDKIIREELLLILQNSGLEVESIDEFINIVEQIKRIKPHIILIDINLPGIDGFTICRQVRDFSQIPIVVVTSRNTEIDELRSITIGGDDFITKPYNIPILIARIHALLKRAYPKEMESQILSHKGLILHMEGSMISCETGKVELTKNEFKIMLYLFRNKDKINSREDIIEYLWDNHLFVDDNTLSVNITRIRDKLEQIGAENFIVTRHRQGYQI